MAGKEVKGEVGEHPTLMSHVDTAEGSCARADSRWQKRGSNLEGHKAGVSRDSVQRESGQHYGEAADNGPPQKGSYPHLNSL